jgi:hypothetical protein
VTPTDEELVGRVAARWNEWLGGELRTPDYFSKGLVDPAEPEDWNKAEATDLAEALAAVLDPPIESS